MKAELQGFNHFRPLFPVIFYHQSREMDSFQGGCCEDLGGTCTCSLCWTVSGNIPLGGAGGGDSPLFVAGVDKHLQCFFS